MKIFPDVFIYLYMRMNRNIGNSYGPWWVG